MSSDNQYTALGPAVVGFQTHGTNIQTGSQISGNQVGIVASCQGAVGDGVQGHGTGNFSGIVGTGGGSAGTGVIGFGGSGGGPGVRGIGDGGPNTNPTGTDGPTGVYGQGGAGAPGVVGQAGSGSADGVRGFATGNFSGLAGFGGSNAGTGVFGAGSTLLNPTTHVLLTGPGVRGIGGGGPNTVPLQSNGLINPVGVYGQGGSNGDGVRGVAGQGTGFVDSWAGVHGIGGAGGPPGASFAGLFDGAVEINGSLRVTGTITKGGGTFQIDHPVDPANKYLVHSFVESPEMKNVYDGAGVADLMGEIAVELPAYVEALNKDFRYQLTPIGAPAPNLHVQEELLSGRFVIAGAMPGQRVCWQMTGIRRDPWALANPVVVERDKQDSEKGYFEHSEAHGMPESMAINRRSHHREIREHLVRVEAELAHVSANVAGTNGAA
jgi:hypothetical protein